MISQSTNRESQRTTFVENLYSSLRQQAAKALVEQRNFIVIASSYLEDGLEESECVELLMIDGLPREAAEGIVDMAIDGRDNYSLDLPEYSFQFEDSQGKIWSSYDINKTVTASNDEDAWEQAEIFIDEQSDLEGQKVISVTRVS